MNKFKHIIVFALVLIFALSMPVSAFAATHDVYDEDDIQDAFDNDTDKDITITLKADITLAHSLEAKTGKVIVINGESFILKNVEFVGETATDGGTVTVNADIAATHGNSALIARDNVTVIVNGDVTGGDNSTDGSSAGAAVAATDSAKVTVIGDVTGGDNSGNASATDDSLAGTGVVATDTASVSVTGDVTGGANTGVNSSSNSAVAGFGVVATDDAKVEVTGNVAGGDSNLTDTQLATNQSANGGTAVSSFDDASVSVTGSTDGGDGAGHDATGGVGAFVADSSSVNVGGNATGGDVASTPSSSYTGSVTTPTSSSVAQAAPGLYAEPEADAKVAGNVTGGNTDAGDAGDGIVLLTITPVTADPGDVVVGGTVTGGTTSDPDGENGAALYLEMDTGVTSLAAGSTANVSAWKLSDASGKMVEASDANMLDEAKDYIADNVIYPVYVAQPKNGAISVTPKNGVAGTKVTVTVTWDKNANLLKYKGISYGGGMAKEIDKNTYEFYIPSGGGVLVYASFDVPQTGDSGNLSLWLGLMFVSSTAFAYPLLRRKKEQ